jgi:hypothetical protein
MVQSPDAGRIRQDYWQTVSDLWIDNFFAPLRDWLHARGLMARIQAHGAPVDLLKAYTMADIPETEQLYADVSLDKILYSSEINSLRKFPQPPFCYEFKTCSVLCGSGLASSFGCFTLARFCVLPSVA